MNVFINCIAVAIPFWWYYGVPRRTHDGPLEDLIEVMAFGFRYVPPWASIPIAFVAFFGISAWFNHSFKTAGEQNLGKMFGGIVALAILAAGIGGYLYRQRHAAFLRQNITLDWVNSLSWQEFETLVGEIFPARGYFVEQVGGGGADGGIDLRLSRQGEKTLVFFGVMTSEGAARGIFVSSGIYTNEALRFAEGRRLNSSTAHNSPLWPKRFKRMVVLTNPPCQLPSGGHDPSPPELSDMWQTDGSSPSKGREEHRPGILGLLSISTVSAHKVGSMMALLRPSAVASTRMQEDARDTNTACTCD